MTVILNRAYAGYASGAVVNLDAPTEAALIAQGLASAGAVANTTTGAATANAFTGVAAIPAGASSVVITNSLVNANSMVFAMVRQAAADGTLLRIERVVPAAGSFTIYGTANATATTLVSWVVFTPAGLTPTSSAA
jgi:hypothetical protein